MYAPSRGLYFIVSNSFLFIMEFIPNDPNASFASEVGVGFDVTRNTATTIGAVVGAGTVVAGGALVTASLPAQMLTGLSISGLALYIGDRQAKDLPINPFLPEVKTIPASSD